MEEKPQEILTFIVENQRFALDINNVDRVIRAVAITKLTDSPKFIEGVIDYYGEVIGVVNLRKRLGYPLHELRTSDRFIIAKTMTRKIAFIVDEVEKLLLPDDKEVSDSKIIDASMQFIKILREDEGIILIYDLENLLNKTDEIELEKFIETNFTTIENV
ncbi:MAG: chemotaxis protein CheW [Paludibacter sp.]